MPSTPDLPTSYLLYSRTTTCKACGASHTTSQLMAVSTSRSPITGLKSSHSTPVEANSPIYDLPIGITSLQDQSTPLCHLCLPSLDRSKLSPLPSPTPPAGLTGGSNFAPSPDRAKAKTPRPMATIDDLV